MVIIIAASCYERQDGCLDSYASNYDIDGDDQCESCCTYPNLSFAIGHYNGDNSFTKGDTIKTANQDIILLDFVYTISQVSLMNLNDTIAILDTVKLNNNTIITDDIVKVKPTSYTNKVGAFKYEGLVEKIKFNIGLPDSLNVTSITNDNHLLNDSNDSLRYNNKYYQQRIKYAKGINFKDTVQINIPSYKGNVAYSFDKNTSTLRGKALTLKFRADYAKWFKSVNVSQSNDAISAQILENQKDFITIE